MWKVLILASLLGAGSFTVADSFSEIGDRLADVSIIGFCSVTVAYVLVARGRNADLAGATNRDAERRAAIVETTNAVWLCRTAR